MKRFAALAALVGLVLVGLSCGGGDSGTGPSSPDPGPVNLVLTTPNSNDGALLLSITGGTVTSVAQQGYEVLASAPGATTKLLVRGTIAGGPIATITVPDRHKLTSYHVTVLQAAARGTYQQLAVQSYSAALIGP